MIDALLQVIAYMFMLVGGLTIGAGIVLYVLYRQGDFSISTVRRNDEP